MLNKLIAEQLNMVTVGNVEQTGDHEFIVRRVQDPNNREIKVGECFLIELENYLLHPSDNFNLHQNWNKNIIPTNKYMQIQVDEIMGKMIKITGIGYDISTHECINKIWNGWLPRKSFKILKEI